MKTGIISKIITSVLTTVLLVNNIGWADGRDISCLSPKTRIPRLEKEWGFFTRWFRTGMPFKVSGEVPVEYKYLQEGKAAFKEEAEHSNLSGQTIKDMLIFDKGVGLFSYVNETVTDWGEQRLRWLLTHPYLAPDEILARQEIICFLMNNPRLLRKIRRILAGISRYDWIDSFLRSLFENPTSRLSKKRKIKKGLIDLVHYRRIRRRTQMLKRCISYFPKENRYTGIFKAMIDDFLRKPVEADRVCKLFGIIAEADVFASLAQAGLRHAVSNTVTIPRILKQEEPLFQMKEGIMPIHSEHRYLPNDFEISSGKPFAIVRGENASGKTIFLRTIGRTAILSQIGSPVPAKGVAITPMAIHSMINISDDPETGRSYTEVEVDELSKIMGVAEGSGKQLFLFDEMLKGMSLTARERVEPMSAEVLLNCGGLTVLTTHSNSMKELESHEKIANYHMGNVENEEEKYKVMKGRRRWSNALRILRKINWWGEDIRKIEKAIGEAGITGDSPDDKAVDLESKEIKGRDIYSIRNKNVKRWERLNKRDEWRYKKVSIKILDAITRDSAIWMVIGTFYVGSWSLARWISEHNIALLSTQSLVLISVTAAIIIIGISIIIHPQPIIRTRQKYILERILGKKDIPPDDLGIDSKNEIPEFLESELRRYPAPEKRPRDEEYDWGKRRGDTYELSESEIVNLQLIDGGNSIFTTVNNARTVWGERRLKWLLKHPYHSSGRIKQRQGIVNTLYKDKTKRDRLKETLGALQDSWERDMGADLKKKFYKILSICLLIFAISYMPLLAVFIWFGAEAGIGVLSIYGFVMLGIFIYGFFYKRKFIKKNTLSYIRDVLKSIDELEKLLEGLSLRENHEIAQLLKDLRDAKKDFADLQETIIDSEFKPPRKRKGEYTDSSIIDMIFPPPDADGYRSKSKYGYALADALGVIGELDSYLSLAEVPERQTHWKTMPEITWTDSGTPVLEIENGHNPLIPKESSQPNSILLNRKNSVLLIGGSHGEGKSTFLRTINQLEILGCIGSFVPAEKMRFSPAEISACLNLEDSPERGLSTFSAFAGFLERIYTRCEDWYFKGRNLIVTFDEFGEGTNPVEARIIAKVIIERFAELGIPMVAVIQDAGLLKSVEDIPGVSIAHPERIGTEVSYRIVPGHPDEVSVLQKILERPLHPSLAGALQKAIRQITGIDEPSGGLIGKYMVTSQIEFSEGYIHFRAYHIDDPERKEIDIRIRAEKVSKEIFGGYRETGISEIDSALTNFLSGFKEEVFLLASNPYGIDGIGTTDTLAVLESLKDNDIALFHELAHAAGIDVTKYIGADVPQMSQHYALRLFQRQRWEVDDKKLTRLIKIDRLKTEPDRRKRIEIAKRCGFDLVEGVKPDEYISLAHNRVNVPPDEETYRIPEDCSGAIQYIEDEGIRPYIMTSDLDSCAAIILYNPETKTGLISLFVLVKPKHIEDLEIEGYVLFLASELRRKGAVLDNLEITVVWGCDRNEYSKGRIQELVSYLKRLKYSRFRIDSTKNLGIRGVRLDLKNGSVQELDHSHGRILSKGGRFPIHVFNKSLGRGEVELLRNLAYRKELWVEDIGFTKRLLRELKDGRIYEVRYNVRRLSESQQGLIREYCIRLNAKAIPVMDTEEEYIIRVTCRDKITGEIGTGQINLEGEDGLGIYPLRIIGMLNIAFAVSSIRDSDDPLVGFIREQYKAITGKELSGGADIRRIILPLPERIDIMEAERLNQLARELLVAA